MMDVNVVFVLYVNACWQYCKLISLRWQIKLSIWNVRDIKLCLEIELLLSKMLSTVMWRKVISPAEVQLWHCSQWELAYFPMVGHSGWSCLVLYFGPLLPLLTCQIHQFSSMPCTTSCLFAVKECHYCAYLLSPTQNFKTVYKSRRDIQTDVLHNRDQVCMELETGA